MHQIRTENHATSTKYSHLFYCNGYYSHQSPPEQKMTILVNRTGKTRTTSKH